MLAGVEITLGARTFIAPPLSRAAFKRFGTALAAMSRAELDQDAVLDVMFDVVFAALQRNYPELTQAEFDDLADHLTIAEPFSVVMTGSRPPAKGEAPASP